MTLVTPSWWCETCHAWWDAAWLLDADDEDTARPYTLRTCPECGNELAPRGRPVGSRP